MFNTKLNKVINKSLDTYMARSRAIASNIANATTPGYRKREVQFEKALDNALNGNPIKGAKTNSKHMDIGAGTLDNVEYQMVRPNDPTLPSGVNNVDIDEEMANLAQNQISYKMAIKRLTFSYNQLNAAINLKPVQ